jgi:hypothetical protein
MTEMELGSRPTGGVGSSRQIHEGKGKGTTMESMGKGRILILIVLTGILIATGVWMILILNQTSGVAIGTHGWIALGLGTFFSIVIGCGLMALMFISSRHGHDEAADPFRKRPPSN